MTLTDVPPELTPGGRPRSVRGTGRMRVSRRASLNGSSAVHLTYALSVALYAGWRWLHDVFLQSDILYNSFVANQLARGHFDVYSMVLVSLPALEDRYRYAALYYLTTAAYLKVLWPWSISILRPAIPNNLFTNVFHTHMGIVLMLGFVLLKLPNLAATMLASGPSPDRSQCSGVDQRLATFLWFASPALVVSALMQAQNDVFAAVITLFAVLAFQRQRPLLMFLILGLAACFKTYPLVLVPPTALLLCNRNFFLAVRNGLISAIPLVIVSLPFLGHDYISRVFGHTTAILCWALRTTEGCRFTSGRSPTWSYLRIAWLRSNDQVDVFRARGDVVPTPGHDVCAELVGAAMGGVATARGVLLALRDRVFAWLWVLANVAIFVDNILNYPGNMDGAMLEPFYGDRNHPANSHFYNYHLFHIWEHLPYAVLDGAYIVCGALFFALALRAGQWLVSRSSVTVSPLSMARLPDAYVAALTGTALLIPYIGTMIIQRLTG